MHESSVEPGAVLPGQPHRSPAAGAASAGLDVDGHLARAMADVADLDEMPVAAHVARFEAAHAALVHALASIDGV